MRGGIGKGAHNAKGRVEQAVDIALFARQRAACRIDELKHKADEPYQVVGGLIAFVACNAAALVKGGERRCREPAGEKCVLIHFEDGVDGTVGDGAHDVDLVAIAQSSPGPIAVNGAIVVGYKLAGLAGALTAAVATVIPPFVIIALVSYFYQLFRDNAVVSRVLSGMQAGVGAVIASVVWDMGADIARQKSVSSMLIMAAAFVLSCVCKVNVVYIVLGCIALGTARTLLGRRKAG